MQTIVLLGCKDNELTVYKSLRSIFYALNLNDKTHDFNLVYHYSYGEIPLELRKQFKQLPKTYTYTTPDDIILIIKKQKTKNITLLQTSDLVSDNFFDEISENAKISIPQHTLCIDNNTLHINKIPKEWSDCIEPDTFLSGITYETSLFIEAFDHMLDADATLLNKYMCCKLLYAHSNIVPDLRTNTLYCRRNSKLENRHWLSLLARLLPDIIIAERENFDVETHATRDTQETPTAKTRLISKVRPVVSRHLHPSAAIFLKDSIVALRLFRDMRSSRKHTHTNKELEWSKSLIATWSNLNNIEPLIRPSREKLDQCKVVDEDNENRFTEVFKKIVTELQTTEHIVLVPHLNRGGADLAALHLVNTIGDQYKTVIFATGYAPSEWFSRVNRGVKCLEAIHLFDGITEEHRLILLTMTLQLLKPKFLSIINSYQGYQLLNEYQDYIPKETKIFLHTYAFDMTEDGYIFNYIEDGIPKTYPRVDHYITDSNTYKEQLERVHGIPHTRVNCIYLPTNTSLEAKPTTNTLKRVLWASRISHAKLVEVAVDVAHILSAHKIEVDFYGVIEPQYQKQNRFLNMLKKIPTARYKGGFDGFNTIPHEKYDVFLLTTKNEGMPNVVIEAIAANHYVIAPPVGGIPEVITQGLNGGLAKDRFSAESYAQEILQYYSMRIDRKYNIARQELNNKITNNHTSKNYKRSLLNLYTTEH